MRKSFHGFAVLVWLVLVFNPLVATAITVDKTCSIEFTGEGCIFDLKAAANGTLTVCTQAGTSGVRWRASIAKVNTQGAVSSVGTGSSTACTGSVQSNVVSGVNYLVIVTYERPLPGTLPTAVTVHFDGPFNSIPNARPRFFEEPQTCKQLSESSAATTTAVDVEPIDCGKMVQCLFAKPGDTDSFTYTAPASGVVSVKIAGPSNSWWELFDPNGSLITSSNGQSQAVLPVSGTYTIKTTNLYNLTGDYGLSLLGVSRYLSCGDLIAYGDLKQRTFDAAGDTDAFKFSGQKDQVVSIKIAGPSNSWWELFDPNGSLITSSNGQSQAVLPVSGTYTIKTTNLYNLTGVYGLSLQLVGGP